MKTTNDTFLAEQEEKVIQILQEAKSLKSLEGQTLQAKPDTDSWSVLECLEHMNRYSEFYLKEFKKHVSTSKSSESKVFSSGWLGKKSADLMRPKKGEIGFKMNTFKSKNPSIDHNVDPSALDQFIEDQKEFLEILDKLKNTDLNTRVKITLPLLKFKLGDALAFHINHELRHMVQIENTLLSVREPVS